VNIFPVQISAPWVLLFGLRSCTRSSVSADSFHRSVYVLLDQVLLTSIDFSILWFRRPWDSSALSLAEVNLATSVSQTWSPLFLVAQVTDLASCARPASAQCCYPQLVFSSIVIVLWFGLLQGDLGIALESPNQKTRGVVVHIVLSQ
jgi:hypothetical protein